MVKNFKGIVKISDVKNEFDSLVETLNSAVDTYNNIDSIKEIDYNKAGSTLGQLGYTLTIGGLKQFMQIYDGYCFGCRVFKVGNNVCKPTGGILVTRDKFYKIPTELVNGYGTKLFYNPTTKKCLVGGTVKKVENITFPSATNNNTPFSVSSSYNSNTAYKALSTQTGLNVGWNMGIMDNTLFGATNILQYMADNKNKKDIAASYFKRRLTFSYKNTLIVKAGTTFSYDIVPSKNYRIPSLLVANSFFALGINNSNTLQISGVDGSAYANDIYSFNVTAPTSATIRVSYKFKKDVTFKSLTLGIAPYILWAGYGNAQNSTNILVQNGRFTGTVQAITEIVDDGTGDNVYKIADLNWEKTTGDKLWLNDLPNTMT